MPQSKVASASERLAPSDLAAECGGALAAGAGLAFVHSVLCALRALPAGRYLLTHAPQDATVCLFRAVGEEALAGQVRELLQPSFQGCCDLCSSISAALPKIWAGRLGGALAGWRAGWLAVALLAGKGMPVSCCGPNSLWGLPACLRCAACRLLAWVGLLAQWPSPPFCAPLRHWASVVHT